EMHGVRKVYGNKNALDGVDLAIPQGSVVGLLGQNAAGKTTLIKAALGLIKIDAGSARIFGEDTWSLSADAKSRLGYVPQVIALYPWMRVRQIVKYIAAFYARWNAQL